MLGLNLPSALAVGYGVEGGAGRGPSPAVWRKFTSGSMSKQGDSMIYVADDFQLFGQHGAVASNTAVYGSLAGQYATWQDTSTVLAQLETAGSGGVIKFAIDATDNHEITMTQGGVGAATTATTSVLGAINRDTSPKLTAYECRFKVSSVVDDVLAIFVGMTEEGCNITNMKADDTGVNADKDQIGFNTVHVNGGTTGTNAILNAVYKKAGQTAQTSIASFSTLVADTYVKAGWVYDPNADPSKRITWYLNGVPKTTYVTDTQMDAATFPDGEELAFAAIAKSGTATASNLQIDWWAWGQMA